MMPAHHSPRTHASPKVADDLVWLRSLARRLATSSDEAEDLVQETWLVAERSDDHARDKRAWLYGVLRNRQRMHRRAAARRRQREATVASATAVHDPDLELHRQRVLSAIREALDELDEGDRQLLLARYCDEHTAPALAERLGISASTVRSRLSRATARVRRSLDERWGGDREAWAPAVVGLPLLPRPPGPAPTGWRATVMAVVVNKIVLGLVAALVATGVWFGIVHEGDPDPEQSEGSSEPSLAEQRAELAARMRAAREQSPPDRTPGSLTGEVLDAATGQPLPGAMVMLAASSGDAIGRRGPQPRTLTGEAGTFSLAELAPGTYRLSAAVPGFLPAQLQQVEIAPGAEAGGTVLRLQPGGHVVEGIITDIGGGVIEGTLVEAKPWGDGKAAGYGVLTDHEGRYRLSLPDGRWKVTAGGEDYTSQFRNLSIDHGPGRADFSLVPGATIEGRVLSRAGGEPVANAVVGFSVRIRRGEGFSQSMSDREQTVVTDAEGRFSMHPLEPGEYSLYASATGLGSEAQTVVQAAIGEEIQGVEVLVDPVFDASGFIVDEADPERGIGGIELSLVNISNHRQLFAVTEPDGYFEVPGLVTGDYMVVLAGSGIVPNGLGDSISIEDRSRDDLIVEVERGVSITGRVDPPMAGKVKVAGRKSHGGMEIMLQGRKLKNAHTRIAADGTFTIDGVPPGEWKVVATGDDGSLGSQEIDVAADALDGIAVALSPRSKVTGTVLDGEGRPVPGVTVDLLGQPDPNLPPVFRTKQSAGTGVTAADGSFVVWGVDPGQYEVTVADAADQPVVIQAPQAVPTVETAAGHDVTELELRVVLPSGRIEGRVQGPDGQPLADAWVTARGQGGDDHAWYKVRSSTTITDAEGYFEFEGLAERPYSLHVRGPDANTRGEAEASVGESVVISLETMAQVRGVVTRGGQPVPRFRLEVDDQAIAVVSEDGSFARSRIEPGERTVVVTTDDGSAHAKVDLEPGGTAQVELELGDWGSVTGVLVSAVDGQPLSGVSLVPRCDGGAKSEEKHLMSLLTGAGNNRTDESGRFSLENLGAGEVRLSFNLGMQTRGIEPLGSHTFDLEAGQALDLGTIAVLPRAEVPDAEFGFVGLDIRTRRGAPSARVDLNAPREPEQPGQPKRVWVTWVEPGGPAANAGLQIGDRVVAVDGIEEAKVGPTTLGFALNEERVRIGQSYEIEVERDGASMTFTVQAIAPPKR